MEMVYQAEACASSCHEYYHEFKVPDNIFIPPYVV